MIFEPLSQAERNELLSLVSDEQKEYLLNEVKRGRRTILGTLWLKKKYKPLSQ